MTHHTSKLDARLSAAMRLIGLCLGVVMVIAIVGYNRSLSIRRQFSTMRERVELLQEQNAELKNELYALIDTQSLNAVATRLGLVHEKNPRYLNVLSGITVAHGR